mmetsp:Transcript_70293/g.187291  ORF Transcript_70293/g.187291 Transcript_70293/m.187291 type:complete len:200 (-) Transcript_70293:168-767(-)
MAGVWHKTENRGFYYGPASNNAWNNDIGWKDAVNRESKLANRFAEQQAVMLSQEPKGSEKGSMVTTSSRDSLYRQFDSLTKDEQILVLKDALSRKERLDKLERESERFSERDLKGLSSKAKAEVLIKALSAERDRRVKKETYFVEMLNEERAARKQAEDSMKALESKLDLLSSALSAGQSTKKDYLRRTKLPVIRSPQR